MPAPDDVKPHAYHVGYGCGLYEYGTGHGYGGGGRGGYSDPAGLFYAEVVARNALLGEKTPSCGRGSNDPGAQAVLGFWGGFCARLGVIGAGLTALVFLGCASVFIAARFFGTDE